MPVPFDRLADIGHLGQVPWLLQEGGGLGGEAWIIGAVLAGLAFLVVLVVVANFGALYIRAWLSDAYVSFATLIGIKLRGVSPQTIVDSRIMARKAGLVVERQDGSSGSIDTDMLETHFLARGNVVNVVRALIAASKADIPLTWDRACAIDLAGRDVLDAVKTSVNPKVIDCPDPTKGRPTVDAVAQDGIQLKAKARVTVRANLDRLVGGATEETIIARVGEGIVTSIGSAQSHKAVLENPDMISKKVLEKGLDAGTAFTILSIDIADVDVGQNIGAVLQAEQAEADKQVSQAKAEERRAMAVAEEQEMVARVQENRAEVVLAEAEIPKAMAQALREGNLGIMDYYNLKNIEADTRMRRAISGDDEGASSSSATEE